MEDDVPEDSNIEIGTIDFIMIFIAICVGGFKQKNNESFDQLVWKTKLKTLV